MARRGFLKGALIVGGVWMIMARPWNWFLAPNLAFEPLHDVPGFRRLAGTGDLTRSDGASAALIGLDPPENGDPAVEARVREDVEALILGEWSQGAPVPVTYFTDIQCPVCRILESRLEGLDGIDLVTREFPLFGDASDLAARAIVTAGLQGRAESMRRRLQRSTISADPDLLAEMAGSMDMDGAQFRLDFESTTVSTRLAEDRALARLFRLPGTPGLIVGRTRVVGLQPTALLRDLIDVEAAG